MCSAGLSRSGRFGASLTAMESDGRPHTGASSPISNEGPLVLLSRSDLANRVRGIAFDAKELCRRRTGARQVASKVVRPGRPDSWRKANRNSSQAQATEDHGRADRHEFRRHPHDLRLWVCSHPKRGRSYRHGRRSRPITDHCWFKCAVDTGGYPNSSARNLPRRNLQGLSERAAMVTSRQPLSSRTARSFPPT